MTEFVTKVMEVVVLPLFILTIGVEIADLANVGVMEVLAIFQTEWLQGSNALAQVVRTVLFFGLWGLAAFYMASGLDKVFKLSEKAEKKAL